MHRRVTLAGAAGLAVSATLDAAEDLHGAGST